MWFALPVLCHGFSPGGAPRVTPPACLQIAVAHQRPVAWQEVEPEAPQAGAGAFVPSVRPHGHAITELVSAPARAAFGSPFSPTGLDAATLARLTALPQRAAAALVEHIAAHGPLERPSDLLGVRHIGAKTAASLASQLQFGREAASDWPTPSLSARRDGVWRSYIVPWLRFVPQSGISRLWGFIARIRRPTFFVSWLKSTFVRANGIDMSESAEPIESFSCLEDLFVRSLKPGLRPLHDDVRTLVSPVDGRVGAMGIVTDGLLLQIKGHTYTLAELLDEPSNARFFEGGAYITLYLSPRDYHRIHAPQAGHVTSARLIPGLLMPVFPEALTRIDHLFARNERIVSYLKSPDVGGMALVAVGATLVGRLRVHYDARLRGNEVDNTPRSERYAKPTWFERGEEMGVFELGSTVVLICQPGMVALDALHEGQVIRMGERIGVSQKPPRGRDTGGGPEFLQPLDEDEL